MSNLKTLEEKYLELGKEIEALKCEHKYPIFKISKFNEIIVRFTASRVGTVMWKSDCHNKIGHNTDNWTPHTDTHTWEDVAYDSERDLWDGQPVYVWDNYTHSKTIRFYDAVNKQTFEPRGKRCGAIWDNYEAVLPEHYTPWMLEAFKTLDRSE